MVDNTTRSLRVIADGAASRFQLWKHVMSENQVETMAEIGVWKGDFAEYILKHSEHIKRYYMVDPWANLPDWNKPYNVTTEAFEDIYGEAMARTEFAGSRRTVLRGRTKDIIDEIADDSLDFVYIDGDHTLRGITIDLIKLLPKVKEGGLIGGDDFVNNPWQHKIEFEPTFVCPFSVYFAEAMDLPFIALPFNQFLIRKTSDSSFSFVDTVGVYEDLSLNRFRSESQTPLIRNVLRRMLSRFDIALQRANK